MFSNPKLKEDFDATVARAKSFFESKQMTITGKKTSADEASTNLDEAITVGGKAKIDTSAAAKEKAAQEHRSQVKESKGGAIGEIIEALRAYQAADKDDNLVKPLNALKNDLSGIDGDKLVQSDSMLKGLKGKLVGNTSTAEFKTLLDAVKTRIAVHTHLAKTVDEIGPMIKTLQGKHDALGTSVADEKAKAEYAGKIGVLQTLQQSTGDLNTPAGVQATSDAIKVAVKGIGQAGGESGKAASLVNKLNEAVTEEVKHTAQAVQPAQRLSMSKHEE